MVNPVMQIQFRVMQIKKNRYRMVDRVMQTHFLLIQIQFRVMQIEKGLMQSGCPGDTDSFFSDAEWYKVMQNGRPGDAEGVTG